jgi:hypothetical protein
VSLLAIQSRLTQDLKTGRVFRPAQQESLLYEYDMLIMLHPACNCNDMNDLAPYSRIVSRPRGFILVLGLCLVAAPMWPFSETQSIDY